jgi:hypothetical protein
LRAAVAGGCAVLACPVDCEAIEACLSFFFAGTLKTEQLKLLCVSNSFDFTPCLSRTQLACADSPRLICAQLWRPCIVSGLQLTKPLEALENKALVKLSLIPLRALHPT